ncbi:MAG: THUMP domain-containing protein, partial [candidate division WOR-3 bacterium]|nr:THUMP domain-containing protein [candidate division WOR-3 bacterium]MDW8151058.1 THUMP domain-containing protein [candidate division WOR-3 bacterium]
MKYLIRYSSEVFLKSESSRKELLSILKENFKKAFKNAKIQMRRDMAIIESEEEISERLKNIFGIENFAKVHIEKFNSFDELIEKAFNFFKERVKDDFKVVCKRKGKHSFRSYDVERALGEKLSYVKRVNVREPKYIAYVDIVDDTVYFYDEKYSGYGGFPVSSQGKGLVLISGGIDSAVASFLSYKMGIRLNFLFFNLGGDSIFYAYNVYRFLEEKFGFTSKGKFYYLDFRPIILEIIRNVDDNYRNMVLKVFFYKFANEVAKKLKIDAIITGESIGQVSTQTLKNISILDKFSDVLILRPLITYRKEEIIKKAMEIGVFDICYKGKEYCAISKYSATPNAREESLFSYLERINKEVLEEVRKSLKIIKELKKEDISDKTYDILVDLDKIDIEEFLKNLDKLDKNKIYLLKCKNGQISSILAKEMEKLGF